MVSRLLHALHARIVVSEIGANGESVTGSCVNYNLKLTKDQ